MLRLYCARTGGRDAAWALVRFAAREYLGVSSPAVAKTEAGKPFFPDFPNVYFSLSHGKNHVLAAIGDAPCGCDVEHTRGMSAALVQRVCSPAELSQFSPLELWVLKESFVKYSGNAKLPLRESVFSRTSDAVLPPDKDASARLYDLGDGVAAVVCRGDTPEEIIFVPPERLDS